VKYVIDASVDIGTYVLEQDSATAIRLRNEYHQGIHELLAPDIFCTEMCNTFLILERRGRILPGEAAIFLKQLLSELPPLHGAVSLMPRALEIANQFRQTVYDSLYASLAEREECECVSADISFVNAVQHALPFVIPLSSLP
jgi:predicted nucleic acid-binding protein